MDQSQDKPPSVKLGDLKYFDGRRVNHLPENPGEYYGPVMGFSGDKPAVLFLKPNCHDEGVIGRGRRIQHVVTPPHVFTEEPDGTLTITASISDYAGPGSLGDGWHGYLTKGVWEKIS